MMELKFAQNFSLIALNGQDSLHLTTAKKAALRSMAAAAILELYMDGGFDESGDMLNFKREDLEKSSITLYQETVLRALLGKKENLSDSLSGYLKRVKTLSRKALKEIERAFADSLKGVEALEEIPSLLGCDLEFKTASVSMREYRSSEELYNKVAEGFRAEVLEEGALSDEAILMLWLLRESGCFHDFFSKEDLKRIAERMSELFESNSLAKKVFGVEIHESLEIAVKSFLNMKKEIMTTPTGIGINFAFPIFQRSESIFIDTEEYFSNKEKRLRDVKARLEEYGHKFTVIREGEVPLIKIDNFLYEAVPTAYGGKIPIHGVRLRKYPLYK